MSKAMLVQALLETTPTIITVSGGCCAEAMKDVAKKAEKNTLLLVQFEHDFPPRYYGENGATKKITLVDSSKVPIPKKLIHVGKEIIGSGFVKLVPNYKELVASLL